VDAVLSTLLDDEFDTEELVARTGKDLETLEQSLPDREVRALPCLFSTHTLLFV